MESSLPPEGVSGGRELLLRLDGVVGVCADVSPRRCFLGCGLPVFLGEGVEEVDLLVGVLGPVILDEGRGVPPASGVVLLFFFGWICILIRGIVCGCGWLGGRASGEGGVSGIGASIIWEADGGDAGNGESGLVVGCVGLLRGEMSSMAHVKMASLNLAPYLFLIHLVATHQAASQSV